jgi:hypothetical protein
MIADPAHRQSAITDHLLDHLDWEEDRRRLSDRVSIRLIEISQLPARLCSRPGSSCAKQEFRKPTPGFSQ